jgi:hypothetical protein
VEHTQVDPLKLLQPDLELIRGTIAGIVDARVREATSTVREPTEVMKAVAIQLQDMNNNLRMLNSTLNILAERLR